LSNDNSIPCIVEFDIDVEAEKEPSIETDKNFDEFSQSKIGEINELIKSCKMKTLTLQTLRLRKQRLVLSMNGHVIYDVVVFLLYN
jgi:hypothetical protein